MSVTAYAPTADDIAWADWIISSVKDGGHVAIEYTRQIFQLDDTRKTLTLIAGSPEEDDDMLAATFGAVGYSIIIS